MDYIIIKSKLEEIISNTTLSGNEKRNQILDLFGVSDSIIQKQQECEHEFHEVWFVNDDHYPFEMYGYECIKCGKTESLA